MDNIGWQVLLLLGLMLFIGLPIYCIVCSRIDCCKKEINKKNYEIV